MSVRKDDRSIVLTTLRIFQRAICPSRLPKSMVMLYKLAQADYQLVRPLFHAFGHALIIPSVIDRTTPGAIYTDDRQSPRTALLCSGEGHYLAGNPDLATVVNLQTLMQETLFQDYEEIALGIDSIDWEPELSTIFLNRTPIKLERKYYQCQQLKLNWRDAFSSNCSIQRIDKQLLSQLQPQEELLSWIEKNWGSITTFLEKGIGCYCLYNGAPVAWSLTDCMNGDRCEIGIYTVPEYRGQGLATLTVAATVEQCLSAGLTTIGWHCDTDNVGSWKVAEKVGFEHVKDYVLYYCKTDEAEHLAEVGFFAFKAGRYQETIDCYKQVFALTEDAPDYYYHLAAEACAEVGDFTTTMQYLEAAIERGWTDRDYTANHEPFQPLHNSPAWQELLDRMDKSTSCGASEQN